MRILHISTRLILGGSQENTVLSCEGQARRGHEVHLAFGPIFGPEGSMLQRVEAFRAGPHEGETATERDSETGRIRTHEIPHLVREVDPIKDRRALGELEALIGQIKPDVVHTHSSKAGILGRLAAWNVLASCLRASVPSCPPPAIVHTVHGPPFMPLEGSPLRRARIALTNHVYTLAERRAAKRCHLIVSVADAMTRQFLARRIGRAEQYITVHSGMEVGRYLHAAPGEGRDEMRRTLGLRDADLVVGTVARLAQHKGHDDLLTALGDELLRRDDLVLLWVGDGWWRDRLTARARQMGLSVRDASTPPSGRAHIVLTGLVPPERVPGLIGAMDILAHPSSREGLPRTVPQALLKGVVPVAYDCDGTGEACIDGVTGRLVPTGDVPALRRAILDLAADPAQRARLAAAGRDLCRHRFAASTMVDRLDEVYARAVAMARG